MKKYLSRLDSEKQFTEIIKSGNYKFSINKYDYDCEYKFVNDNILILRINNKNYMVTNQSDTEGEVDNTHIKLEINARQLSVISKSELDLLIEKLSSTHSEGKIKSDIVSPMPGAIVKINVKENQVVKKGDVLLVLEAMKMENEIKSPNEAVVKKILVEEKKSVNKGQLLIKLEKLK